MKTTPKLGLTLILVILSTSSLTARAAHFDDIRGSWALTADHDQGVLYCPHIKIDSYVSTYTNTAGRTVNRYNIDQVGKCQLASDDVPEDVMSISATTNAGYFDITEIETVSGYMELTGFTGMTFQLTMDIDGSAMQGYYNDEVYPYVKTASMMKRVDYRGALYSNFGVRDSYKDYGGEVVGDSAILGYRFVATESGVMGSVEAAVIPYWGGAPPDEWPSQPVTFQLYTDVDGEIGELLEEVNAMAVTGGSGIAFGAASETTALSAGTAYWLLATVPASASPSSMFWWYNVVEELTKVVRGSEGIEGLLTYADSADAGAFRINSTGAHPGPPSPREIIVVATGTVTSSYDGVNMFGLGTGDDTIVGATVTATFRFDPYNVGWINAGPASALYKYPGTDWISSSFSVDTGTIDTNIIGGVVSSANNIFDEAYLANDSSSDGGIFDRYALRDYEYLESGRFGDWNDETYFGYVYVNSEVADLIHSVELDQEVVWTSGRDGDEAGGWFKRDRTIGDPDAWPPDLSDSQDYSVVFDLDSLTATRVFP